MHLLKLESAAPGQLMVQMLPRAAERLPRALRLLAKMLAVRARRPGEQLLVEVVPIRRDLRQESRQRHRRIVPARRVAARAGSHEDRSRQHGGGFFESLAGARLEDKKAAEAAAKKTSN